MALSDADDTSRDTRGGLSLRRGDEHAAEIDALAHRYGGRVGLEAALADLNRQGRRTWAPGRAVRRAFTWDARDRRDPQWWPQGISWGSAGGRGHFVTTWYAKETRGEKHGSRISLYDPATRRYRHVLLVTAKLADGEASSAALSMHAGGIVRVGPWLHVAATGTGFHTFHVDDVLRVPDERRGEAHGYRYVLPVRFTHRAQTAEGVERLRYSFLSLDRGTSPPELLVGEYGRRKQTRRLVRFPLDDAGLPAGDAAGSTWPLSVETSGVAGMQGAVRAGGDLYATASHGPWGLGSVYAGEPGSMRRHRWWTPFGPEDLTWWPETGRLWTVTEHPRRRWICGVARPAPRRS